MLTEQRRQLVIAQELFRLLLDGTIADATSVSYLQEIFDKYGPTFFTYEPVSKGQVFPADKYNEQLQSIQLDLQFMYGELYEIASRAIATYASSRIQYAQYKSYTSRILNQLRLLAAGMKDLEDNFAIIFDDFTSLQKTDLDLSTEGIVSTEEEALVLPYTEKGRRRYYRPIHQDLISLEVTAPNQYKERAQLEGMGPEAAFTDSRTAWAEAIRTTTKDSPEYDLIAPVGGASQPEVTLTQISILPYAAGEFYVDILHSLDKENWHRFEGYDGSIVFPEGGAALVIDFPATTFRYIRLNLTKGAPDNVERIENKEIYRWVFGISQVSFFIAGRIPYGLYVSKPQDLDLQPEQLSLEADVKLPHDTKVLFSIALAKNNKAITDFLPVKPTNFKSGSGPEVIYLARRKTHRNEFLSTNASKYLTWRNIDFYSLGTVEDVPVFGSAYLYRGFQAWNRVTQGATKRRAVENIFVSFAASDTQPIYLPHTEIPSESHSTKDKTVELSLRYPAAYSDGWSLIPPANSSLRPMYSVESVLQHYQQKTRVFPPAGSTMTYPTKTNSITGTSYPKIDLTYWKDAANNQLIRLNFILTGDDKPVLEQVSISNPQTFLPGIDYIIDTKNVDGRQVPTGTITIPPGSQLGAAAAAASGQQINLRFTYTLDPDITSKVTKVDGNIIQLDDVEVENGDVFEVTYNYTPLPPHGVIGSSMRVKKDYGDQDPNEDYVEGRDYKLDLRKGIIERVHTGRIPSNQGVFLDFSVNDSPEGVEQFYTWVYQSQDTPLRVRLLQPPQPDLRVSEAFYLIKGNTVIDLTQAREWVDLPRGWYQFVVYSKSPEGGACMLYQVQQLVNQSGYAVFRHRGQVFSTMAAERTPRQQVTWPQLKQGTLKADHSYFAITDSKDIVINYQPGTAEELLYLEPSAAAYPSTPDVLEYVLEWQSSESITEPGDQAIVKCELQGTELSPRVYRYVVKAR